MQTNGLEVTHYYRDEALFNARGIDDDLYGCLEYNAEPGFGVEHIDRVLAVYEGEHDGDDWRWLLLLMDGRFAYLRGGCDYTGWDCQSWASSVITPSVEAVLQAAAHDENGYGDDTAAAVTAHLRKQVETGKDATWRETMNTTMRAEPH